MIMAMTGLPPYKPPIEQSLRCTCWTRYVVFVGGCLQFDETLCKLARERAAEMGAHFVDARETPWINCYSCGGALDFSNEVTLAVM